MNEIRSNFVALSNCTVCREEYRSPDKRPFSIPVCGHQFCLICIQSIQSVVGIPGLKKCPVCRAVFRQENIGAPNLAFEQILEMVLPLYAKAAWEKELWGPSGIPRETSPREQVLAQVRAAIAFYEKQEYNAAIYLLKMASHSGGSLFPNEKLLASSYLALSRERIAIDPHAVEKCLPLLHEKMGDSDTCKMIQELEKVPPLEREDVVSKARFFMFDDMLAHEREKILMFFRLLSPEDRMDVAEKAFPWIQDRERCDEEERISAKDILWILGSILRVDPRARNELVENILLLVVDENREGKIIAGLFDFLSAFSPDERESLVRQCLLLASKETYPTKKLDLLISIHKIPPSEREDVVQKIHPLLAKALPGLDLRKLMKDVAAIPTADRENVVQNIRHFLAKSDATVDLRKLIKEVVAVAPEERKEVLELAFWLVSSARPIVYIGEELISEIAQLAQNERIPVLDKVRSFLEGLEWPNHAQEWFPRLIPAMAAVSREERDEFVAMVRSLTRNEPRYECSEIFVRLAYLPLADRRQLADLYTQLAKDPLFQEHPSWLYLNCFLTTMATISFEERYPILEKAVEVIRFGLSYKKCTEDCYPLSSLIEAFKLPPADRDNMVKIAKAFAKEVGMDLLDPFMNQLTFVPPADRPQIAALVIRWAVIGAARYQNLRRPFDVRSLIFAIPSLASLPSREREAFLSLTDRFYLSASAKNRILFGSLLTTLAEITPENMRMLFAKEMIELLKRESLPYEYENPFESEEAFRLSRSIRHQPLDLIRKVAERLQEAFRSDRLSPTDVEKAYQEVLAEADKPVKMEASEDDSEETSATSESDDQEMAEEA